MKKTLCLMVSSLMVSFAIASTCEDCRVVTEKPIAVKTEVAHQTTAEKQVVKDAQVDLTPTKGREMVRCYRKNKKPVTMEDEAMRRAKVFHRGLPIEGCAPLSPEEHKARFEEEKRKQQEKAKAEAKQ